MKKTYTTSKALLRNVTKVNDYLISIDADDDGHIESKVNNNESIKLNGGPVVTVKGSLEFLEMPDRVVSQFSLMNNGKLMVFHQKK